jgi:hypothetical protein
VVIATNEHIGAVPANVHAASNPPTSPAAAISGATGPAANTYYYKVPHVLSGGGVTAASIEESLAVNGSQGVLISWTPTASVPHAQTITATRIYRGTATGAEAGYFTLTGTGTSFTDTGTALTGSSAPPTTNTGFELFTGLTSQAVCLYGSSQLGNMYTSTGGGVPVGLASTADNGSQGSVVLTPFSPQQASASLLVSGWPQVAIHPALFAPNDQFGGVTNGVFAVRVTIPKTGIMTDISVLFNNATGNFIAGAYDTGQTTSTVRTLLTALGSVSAAGDTNAWISGGNPGISVTEGQQVDLVVITNGTGLNLWSTQQNNPFQLLAPYNQGAAVLGKQAWTLTAGSFALPATVAESSATASGELPQIMAYIT